MNTKTKQKKAAEKIKKKPPPVSITLHHYDVKTSSMHSFSFFYVSAGRKNSMKKFK
jgi:hypothetical protein